MKVEVKLFGAFRDHQPDARVALELAEGATVADLRRALETHAAAHWPAFNPKLLAYSAFASDRAVLREADPIPADGQMAVLPPVSGG
ncbi:MoaD/ThiS family protein [Thermomonas brevis]|uniref:MoaD/ThiS family protein n=1 Tax=Thermomonas brevis TaxID=215691 RepID=A0A7G9QSD5_9GAMM|nr:MoaD/ThiS family protein [Thermomonas brevis]QNN46260.1 MoaD/ThiS family protein [Thermomonas brevis]